MVPGGARGRARVAASAIALLVPPRPRRRTATRCRPAGCPSFEGPTWTRTTEPGRHARRVVPPPVHGRAAGPELGPPGRPPRARGRSSASGSTAAPPASGSTPPRCWSRTPTLPEVPDDPGPGEHPTHDRDELHDDLPRLARRRRLVPRRRGCSSASCGCRTSSGSPRTSGRTSSTPRSTSTSWPGRGTPASLRESIDADARRARPGRRAGDLGPLQPRRHPAGHALRPRGLVVRVRRPSGSGTPTDVALGRRRARAAALLAAALPGSLYIYQGDELGLDEVEVLPARPDPGPDALPLRRHRSRPRRLPRAAALVRAEPRRSASARRGAAAEPWLPPAGPLGRPDGRGPGRRPGFHALACTVPPSRIRRVRARPRDGALRLAPVRPGVLAFAAWRPVRLRSPTCPAPRRRCRRGGGRCSPAHDALDGRLPRDATGLAARPDRDGPETSGSGAGERCGWA